MDVRSVPPPLSKVDLMTEPVSPGTSPATIGVLLAAGAGTRLGRGPKALLPYRGRTLVEVIADALLDGGCHQVVVVLGAAADDVLAATDLSRHRVVVNDGWASGMGGSFRCGVAEAGPHDVLVALVDQPGITSGLVTALIQRHRPGRVTAAAFAAPAGALRRGHPVLFDAALAAQAAAEATGDAGARAFLQAHPALIDLVDCTLLASGPAGGADIDTSAQLHLLD